MAAGSAQLGDLTLGDAQLGGLSVVGGGSSSTAYITGQFGPITTAMRATTGNEDVDIDSTFGPITTTFSITNQGVLAAISGQFGPITTAFRIDTAAHAAFAISGQFGPITSALAITATPDPRAIRGGSSLTDILNFSRHHIHHPYKDDDEDEEPPEPEEQEPEQPLIDLPPPMREPTPAEIAMHHAMQQHQIRMKQQAMLHLLSQV